MFLMLDGSVCPNEGGGKWPWIGIGCNVVDGFTPAWEALVAAGRAYPVGMFCCRGGDLEYGPRTALVGSVF